MKFDCYNAAIVSGIYNLPNTITSELVTRVAGAPKATIRMGNAELCAIGLFLTMSFRWTIFFIIPPRTIFLAITDVLLVDAKFCQCFIQITTSASKFGFVTDYIAFEFIFSMAAVVGAIAYPGFLVVNMLEKHFNRKITYQNASTIVTRILVW